MEVSFAFLLLCALAIKNNVGLAAVSVPQNVSVDSQNTQYILTWAWDKSTAGNNATFTAEYIPAFKLQKKRQVWITVCSGTRETFCDFTNSELLYLGMFEFRVRASIDGRNSDWVRKEFCPHKDAALGPPSRVELTPAGNLLDVSISPPLTSTNGSMSDVIFSLYYRIQYWSQAEDPQGRKPKEIQTSITLVTLPELEAWTRYCVMVQSCYDYYNKSSRYTAAKCMQTEGDTPPWQILLYFLLSLVVCFLLVLLPCYIAFRFCRVLKSTFYPSNQLPLHIQEYLCGSSGSDLPRLLTPESEAELCCDRLTVIPEVVLLEVHTSPPLTAPPSGLDQDSGRHSRHGSGDSGVYSTEGGSAQRDHGNSGGEPIGREEDVDSWQMHEKVKVEEMGRKHANEDVDAGVMDMFV
ncbi:hypothetical protein UPYG_G00158450 [Umbra pygmaea]|uniref:Fibronectin type-III domain-containing protein n=1 Tax=Umbra pygmaea TaxID=75934 RepID=A0ABD0WYR2_UMBPY